jgi:hypothetical protein
MRRSRIAFDSKNRLRAVFLCRVLMAACLVPALGGCSLHNGSPALATIFGLLPGHGSVTATAKKIPYATIDLSIGRRGGLLVLAEQTPGLTFWKSGQNETIVLHDGVLQSTSGLEANLHMTQVYGDDAGHSRVPWRQAVNGALHYNILRSWTTADGKQRADRAQVVLRCAQKPETVALPLTKRALQRCVETWHWDRGGQTQSVLWRDRGNHEIWAADTVAWPGGPHISWQVARPWW